MLCQHNLMFSQWFEEICWHTLSPQYSHHLLVDLRVPWRAPFNQTISMSVLTFTVPWMCVGMKLASPQRPPCCCFVHLLAQGLADPWGCVFPRQDGGLGPSAASAAEMATVSSDDRRREVLWALFQSLPATELPGPQLAYFSKSPGLRDWREAGASLDGNTAKFRASCSKLGGFFSWIHAHRWLCILANVYRPEIMFLTCHFEYRHWPSGREFAELLPLPFRSAWHP